MENYSAELGSVLTQDELQLRANGHKGELPRRFSRLAALSFAFGITNSWIGISATFTIPLACGGGPAVFYSLLVAGVACFIITAGLAELASAYPTSGGQYHFAYCVSSPNTRAFTAFVTGWVSMVAWCFVTASSAIYAAKMIAALAAVYHEDYVSTQWQIYMMYIAILCVCAAIVVLAPRNIPLMEKILFFGSLSAFFVYFVTVLATSKTKKAASVVFTQYVNQVGWNDGFSFMLACGTAMFVFIGTDGVIHLAEEIPHPGKNVPQVMILTMIIGIITSVPWTLAFMFCVKDYDAVGSAAQPLFEIFSQTIWNENVALFFILWFLVLYLGCVLSGIATAGRQTWAFARDNGLPYSPFLARVHPVLKAPVNATLACTAFCCVYGAIYCGSTLAFNSFLSASILFINLSYIIPQAVLLYRGRGKILPERYLNLGAFGAFCNAFSTIWVVFYIILFAFPTTNHPTAQNMNYVGPVFVGVMGLIGILWVCNKRHTFVGPELEFNVIVAQVNSSIEGEDAKVIGSKE